MVDNYKKIFQEMQKAGSLAADTLDQITPFVKPGTTTEKLDKISVRNPTSSQPFSL